MTERDDRITTIQADESKALRAEKTTEKARGLTGTPRTAVRYLGEDEYGEHQFQVVTTRTESFPEGTDKVDTHGLEAVSRWVHSNDPEVIDVTDDDGFEDTNGREVPA